MLRHTIAEPAPFKGTPTSSKVELSESILYAGKAWAMACEASC